jgi:hypothetical protein
VTTLAGATLADLSPDAQRVEEQVAAVLGEELYWFPVRHHSPAVAQHLEAAIFARRPKVIFLEAPAEAGELVAHLVDSRTKPPIAIYSSYRDDDNVLGLAGIASPAPDIPARFACWYPLLACSPEYVTLQAAKKIGARVVFMDLPHHAGLRPAAKDQPGAGAPGDIDEGAGGAASSVPTPGPDHAHEIDRDSERLMFESGFYQALAESAGFKSWNEAWDTLFEFGTFGDDFEAFRRELAIFCAAARQTSDPDRIAADGTLERERFMLRTIRESLATEKLPAAKAVVVCGGFHLFLDRHDQTPPPEPPPGALYTTLVPYSYFRMSELSGYAAGNRAPQFYQRVWDLRREGREEDLLAEHVIAVLRRARQDGEPVSSADAISVCQHARMLAALRGRARPVLDDIHDALVTCCCKGNPQSEGTHLLRAIDAIDIGHKIGRVTPALGRLPIVNDFFAQLDELNLGELMEKEQKVMLTLDKRQPLDARRSELLHRLAYLEIPFAEMPGGPSGDFTGTIFRERWSARWGPKVEPALVERNLYGDSIEAAVAARLRESLAGDEGNAGKTCAALVRAVDMNLPDLVRHVEETAGRAIDDDPRFESLVEALSSLTVLDRYAVFHNLRRDLLADLVVRCYDRACFAVLDTIAVPDEQQPAVVAALKSVAEVVWRGDRPELDRQLFIEHVVTAARDTQVPFLRGAYLGLLTELGERTAEDLAGELAALSRAPVEVMITAGDFLDGVLAVSHTSILLGAAALVEGVDQLLRAAEWEAFLTMLPRLRGACERLSKRQRLALADKVAERYGLVESEKLTKLETSVAAAARLAAIDARVAHIMEQWEL